MKAAVCLGVGEARNYNCTRTICSVTHNKRSEGECLMCIANDTCAFICTMAYAQVYYTR